MENKPIESMNSDELSNRMDEVDKNIITQMDMLDKFQADKHNKEVALMELNEGIRMCKKLISKMRIEKEIIERMFWRSKGK